MIDKKINKRNPITVYVVLSVLGIIVVFLCLLISHGELFDDYFWHDQSDTGMDFLHSIEYTVDRMPFIEYGVQYPPLANVFFYILSLLVPTSISAHWGRTFTDSADARVSEWDLRLWQPTMVMYVLFVMLASMILIVLVRRLLYGHHHAEAVAWCMAFSYGIVYAVERGNILLLVIPLVLIYLMHHDDPDIRMRELAIVCLAAAAGLKLYPAIYGILLLRDKNVAGVIRAAIYFVASLVLSAFVFHEGLDGISLWINNIIANTETSTEAWVGLSIPAMFSHAGLCIDKLCGTNLANANYTIPALVVLLLLVVIALLMPRTWQALLAMTLVLMLYTPQPQYILSFTLIPMVFYLRDEQEFTRDNIVPFLVMTYLLLPLPIFGSSLRNKVDHIVLAIAIVWCVVYSVQVIRTHSIPNYQGMLQVTRRQWLRVAGIAAAAAVLCGIGLMIWRVDNGSDIRFVPMTRIYANAEDEAGTYRSDHYSTVMILNSTMGGEYCDISFDVGNMVLEDGTARLFVQMEDKVDLDENIKEDKLVDGKYTVRFATFIPVGVSYLKLEYSGNEAWELSTDEHTCYYTISNIQIEYE